MTYSVIAVSDPDDDVEQHVDPRAVIPSSRHVRPRPELDHKIDKGHAAARSPSFVEALLNAQVDLRAQGKLFQVIIIIAEVEGRGQEAKVVNLLHEWMDPRFLVTTAFDDPTDEESERPRMWRYWRALPPKGKVGILFRHGASSPSSTASSGASRTRSSRSASPRSCRFDARYSPTEETLPPQVLVPPHEEAAEEAAARPREGPRDALARDPARLEVLRALRRIREDGRAAHPANEHGGGAVDQSRSPRRIPPTAEGLTVSRTSSPR